MNHPDPAAAYVTAVVTLYIEMPDTPMGVDQILPDPHRVRAALQLLRDQFAVRLAMARRSATRFLGRKVGDHLYGRF